METEMMFGVVLFPGEEDFSVDASGESRHPSRHFAANGLAQ